MATTNIFTPQAQKNKIVAGVSSDTQVKDPNKFPLGGARGPQSPTPPTPVKTTPPLPQATGREAMIAQNKARNVTAFQKQGAAPTTGTVFDPAQALQTQQPGDPNISPYVPGEPAPDVTPPALPSTADTGTIVGAGASAGVDTVATAEAELTPGFDEWAQGNDQLFDQASELKDEKIASYEQLHEDNLASLSELENTMKELTLQKNALVAGSAKIQSLEIEAAYNANAEALRIAKERLDNSQRKILAEREMQLERKKVNEENMLALIGGFGSMAGNKMLIDSVEEGESKMAWLKSEFNLQDQEHSSKVVQLNNIYKNDKLKLEQWKQEQILSNFENLQSYIQGITEDEMMSNEDKVIRINNAKDQYNNTISQLHQTVIDGRFELSREIIVRADQLREEMEQKQRDTVGDARADLALLSENYAFEDYSGLSTEVKNQIAQLEKDSGLPSGFAEQAIENFKKGGNENLQIRFEKDNQGNLTIVGIDKKTGQVINQTTLEGVGSAKISAANTVEGPEGNMLSKGVFTSGRLLNEPMGSSNINGVEVKAKAAVINKLNEADASMKAAGLAGLDIRSSFRNNQEQADIGTDTPEATQAAEGESFHEAGQAIDVNNYEEAAPYLNAVGMVNDLSWDPGHFSIGETNTVKEGMAATAEVVAEATAEDSVNTYETEFGDFTS